MPDPYVFGVRAFGCKIQASSSCLEAHKTLERYIFPTLPREAKIKRPDLLIRIHQDADQFQLSVNDAVTASAPQAINLVPDLIRALDDAVIEKLTSLRAVHAGAVVWNGRALLLPGMTHAGKSSLVAELLRHGATYFSDEYALIDAEGRVHPYPRPLLLRNGRPEQFPVLPGECGSSAGDSPAPIGWIFSLEYRPASTWNVSAVSQGEALMILLRNTPHVLSESPDLVGIFQRAVAGAVCYKGQRSEVSDSVEEILRLVGGDSKARL